MALQFSDSVNKTGLYELFQDLTKTNTTSYPIAKFTRDANNAFAEFIMLAIMAAQKWEFDDTNQTDYPIATMNITSGQGDYPFTTDNSTTPNQILDISRIELSDANGNWKVLEPFDQMDESQALTQLAKTTGIPRRYGKLANGIWLDPIPNFTLANAMKIYFGRTGVYFLSTDTTKKAGIPDHFHEYLAYRPAALYCEANLPSLAAGYFNFVNDIEQVKIPKWYFFRNKDERKNMKVKTESSR